MLSEASVQAARSKLCATWAYDTGELVVAVSRGDVVTSHNSQYIVGAYSPVVLSFFPDARHKEMCSVAMNVVFNYYSLTPEEDDMKDLVEAMCYRVSSSPLPITTREGMLARRLGWMETVMACDYTKTLDVRGSSSRVYTATSATMCANFFRNTDLKYR